MNVIYEPKGKAGEYSPLALNIYNGCDHLCKYCYVKTSLQNNNQFLDVIPKKDLLRKLRLDCKNGGVTKQVLLSFTGDAYCNKDVEIQLTRECLKVLLEYQIPIAILTKGGSRLYRDLDLLVKFDNIKIGSTLTFDNDYHSKHYEEGASLPDERIAMLKKCKEYGLNTFVSLEPVFSIEQTLNLVKKTIDFVDLYKIGKLNHFKVNKEVDWTLFLYEITKLLNYHNKNYYIKDDLFVYNKGYDLNPDCRNSNKWFLKKEIVPNTLF